MWRRAHGFSRVAPTCSSGPAGAAFGSRRQRSPCFGQIPTSSLVPALHHSNMRQQLRHKSHQAKYTRGQLPDDLKDMPGSFIGCLYESLPDADEYGSYKMPDEHVETYKSMGFLKTPRPVLDQYQCDTLSDELMTLADNVEHHPRTECLYNTSLADLTGGPLFYCQGQWRACWGMHDLIYMPSLCVAASQLLGNSKVQLFYDEAMMKVPKKGPCIPWQQNYARWQHTYPVNHCTVLIALDTLTADKGSPCIIPGSHFWREGTILPVPDYDASRDEAAHLNSIWDVVNEEEKEMLMDMPPESIELERGQALFLHPKTVYATHMNKSFDPSRCLMLHYMGPTMTVRAGAVLPRTTRFPAKTPIEGAYFPVVFDPALVDGDMGGEADGVDPDLPQLEGETEEGEVGEAEAAGALEEGEVDPEAAAAETGEGSAQEEMDEEAEATASHSGLEDEEEEVSAAAAEEEGEIAAEDEENLRAPTRSDEEYDGQEEEEGEIIRQPLDADEGELEDGEVAPTPIAAVSEELEEGEITASDSEQLEEGEVPPPAAMPSLQEILAAEEAEGGEAEPEEGEIIPDAVAEEGEIEEGEISHHASESSSSAAIPSLEEILAAEEEAGAALEEEAGEEVQEVEEGEIRTESAPPVRTTEAEQEEELEEGEIPRQ